MPSKHKRRWLPSKSEFKTMVALVMAESSSGSVMDVFYGIRRRCPDWAVTPQRVRKTLAKLQSTSKRRSGKRPNPNDALRAFPHDVVELCSSSSSSSSGNRPWYAPWQWRGQVLRVAGYDDGEPSDEDDLQLPPQHCSVFWLGENLEQWPHALTKSTSLRVLDRPWVLGDRVASASNPQSLGTVIGVNCRLWPVGINEGSPSMEVPFQQLRAVGGFRAVDWVAHEGSKWIGKVEEAVYRVEVELCSRRESRTSRPKGRHRPPLCVFQVSSEGLHGLEPAGAEDVTPQELSPHFPGQRVKAPARLWRQAEWLRGGLGRRAPRRGASICGIVSSVECCLVAVRWLAGISKNSAPDEWVLPDSLRTLSLSNSSEGWAIGDHVQAPSHWSSPSAVVVESRTIVDVRWADGTVEENIPSVKLCPRPHVSAHDFLPFDFVARSADGFGDASLGVNDGGDPPGGSASPVQLTPTVHQSAFIGNTAATAMGHVGATLSGNVPSIVFVHGTHRSPTSHDTYTSDVNTDDSTYGYSGDAGTSQSAHVNVGAYHGNDEVDEILDEILSGSIAEDFNLSLLQRQVITPLGVVTSVNLQARTATVQWIGMDSLNPQEGDSETQLSEPEEMSVFELSDHAQVDVRLGDTVLLPPPSGILNDLAPQRWCGRVSRLRADGCACVELLDGSSEWRFVRHLVVVEDVEGSVSDGGAGSSDDAADTSEVVSLSDCDAETRHSNKASYTGDPDKEEDDRECEEAQPTSPHDVGLHCEDWYSPHSQSQEQPAVCAGLVVDSRSSESEETIAHNNDAPSGLPEPLGVPSSSSSAPFAFDCYDDDVEPTDHYFGSQPNTGTRQRMAAVRREMIVLRKGLLESSEGCVAPIFVRTYSSRSDLFRAMVVGPPGTPYENVPLFFDFALPAEYPREAPLAHFHANYVGNERLNPNLYVDGKVCLSLLGTWSGPAWDPERSTLLQVLVSLQGLVLVEEPYFNEPGHEFDAGTEQGHRSSALYNEHARLLALRAALNVSQSPPHGFEQITANFFERAGAQLVAQCEEALGPDKASLTSEGFRRVLAKSLLPRLRARWGISLDITASSSSVRQ